MRSLTRVRSAILGFAALTASAFAQTPPMQSQFQVSQDTLSYQSTYGVAMDDAGRFVVTWLNYNGVDHTDDCTARLFDPSGAAEGNQFGISASATDQFDGPVAKDASGRFIVVWFENETVMGRRFQPNGTPIGATFTVTDSATNDVFVASDEAGNFVVTWSRFVSGPEFDVFARIYDSSGAPVGGEFPVNSYTTLQQQARGVARKAANGQFVITWVGFGAGGPGIWARTFDASGNPTTGELHVNQGAIPTVLPLSTVGINGAGEFVVAWEGVTAPPYQGIFARQFDSKGQPLGPQFPVANGGTNDRRDPQIASDRSGNFLVTWTATNGDGDADAIGARAYDRFGTPTSSEFVVNEATTGSQYGARVAINDSSRFVVAWSTPDGSDYGVVARRSGVDASASIGVDSFASFDVPSAAGNGVIEPGETVDVATAWVNDTAGDLALSGAATDFSGPTGATYTLDDAVADYGTIAAGATGSCSTTATTWVVNVGQDGTNFVDQVSGNSTSTIHVGDTVHWVWVEGGSHSSTSGPCPPCAGDEIWESPIQDNGTFDHTFNAAGNFPYFCIPHDVEMTGTVVVVPDDRQLLPGHGVRAGDAARPALGRPAPGGPQRRCAEDLAAPHRRELPRRGDGQHLLCVHRDALSQRHHRRMRRRRLLSDQPCHAGADGRLPSQGQIRRGPHPASVHRHRLHRRALRPAAPSIPGSRSWPPCRSPEAAAEASIAPTTPSRGSRWPSSS